MPGSRPGGWRGRPADERCLTKTLELNNEAVTGCLSAVMSCAWDPTPTRCRLAAPGRRPDLRVGVGSHASGRGWGPARNQVMLTESPVSKLRTRLEIRDEQT